MCFVVGLTGGISSSEPPPNPTSWLSDKSWGELVRLGADVKDFEGLEQSFRDSQTAFKVGGIRRFGMCCSSLRSHAQ
jgi:hypothetical protein